MGGCEGLEEGGLLAQLALESRYAGDQLGGGAGCVICRVGGGFGLLRYGVVAIHDRGIGVDGSAHSGPRPVRIRVVQGVESRAWSRARPDIQRLGGYEPT